MGIGIEAVTGLVTGLAAGISAGKGRRCKRCGKPKISGGGARTKQKTAFIGGLSDGLRRETRGSQIGGKGPRIACSGGGT